MTTTANTQVTAAILAHGAKAVYDAASARMSGNRLPLQRIGLAAPTIGAANEIMVQSFAMMNNESRAADLAAASIALAKL